jgi:hypothetical protein
VYPLHLQTLQGLFHCQLFCSTHHNHAGRFQCQQQFGLPSYQGNTFNFEQLLRSAQPAGAAGGQQYGAKVIHVTVLSVSDKPLRRFSAACTSAGTLCNAAKAVKDGGARSVVACATHGVLSGAAVRRINESALDAVAVTNSIAPTEAIRGCSKIQYISIAPLLAEAIRRIDSKDSLSSLFV